MKRVGTSGFTIVELLIVIVVIAILAAITIVSYNGITNSANESAIQSDLKSIASQIETSRIKSDSDTYPYSVDKPTLRSQLSQLNVSPARTAYSTTNGTEANLLYISNKAGKEYAVVAKAKSGKIFYWSSRTNRVETYPFGNFPGSGAGKVRENLLGPTADIADTGEVTWGHGGGGWDTLWIK